MIRNQNVSRYGEVLFKRPPRRKKRAYSEEQMEKRRIYSRWYRKTHAAYFKEYERKHWFKLKIQRKLWMKKHRKTLKKYWTQEQHREYLRNWRAKRKDNKDWHKDYLGGFNVPMLRKEAVVLQQQ